MSELLYRITWEGSLFDIIAGTKIYEEPYIEEVSKLEGKVIVGVACIDVYVEGNG